MDTELTFGQKLKELRKGMKLTQKEAAERIGVSLRTYSSYERDQAYPKKEDYLKNISNVFNCSILPGPKQIRIERFSCRDVYIVAVQSEQSNDNLLTISGVYYSKKDAWKDIETKYYSMINSLYYIGCSIRRCEIDLDTDTVEMKYITPIDTHRISTIKYCIMSTIIQ